MSGVRHDVVEESCGVAVADRATGVLGEPHERPMCAAVPQTRSVRRSGSGPLAVSSSGLSVRPAAVRTGRTRRPRSRRSWEPSRHRTRGRGLRQSGRPPPTSSCTARSLGCSRPLSRATRMPRLGHHGSSRTREAAEVTSCTGPTTRCILGSRCRMPCLAASPRGPIRLACRR